MVAGFWDGTLRIYDIILSEAIVEIKLTTTITHTAISAGGGYLAAFNREDGVVLIKLATGEQHTLWSSAVGASSA